MRTKLAIAVVGVLTLSLLEGTWPSGVLSEPLPQERIRDFDHVFRDTPIRLFEIRPGDFVVVEVAGGGGRAMASAVTVTLRGKTR